IEALFDVVAVFAPAGEVAVLHEGQPAQRRDAGRPERAIGRLARGKELQPARDGGLLLGRDLIAAHLVWRGRDGGGAARRFLRAGGEGNDSDNSATQQELRKNHAIKHGPFNRQLRCSTRSGLLSYPLSLRERVRVRVIGEELSRATAASTSPSPRPSPGGRGRKTSFRGAGEEVAQCSVAFVARVR